MTVQEHIYLSRLLWSVVALGVSALLFWWRRLRRRDPYFSNDWLNGLLPFPTVAGFALLGVYGFGLAVVLNLALLVASLLGIDVRD